VAPSDYLGLMDAALRGGEGTLPPTRALTAQYLLLFEGNPDALGSIVSEKTGKVQVLVRLLHGPTGELRDFMNRVTAALPALVAPLRAWISGTIRLRLQTADEFTNGLYRQLFLSSLAIAALLGLALRSVRLGLVALVPNLLPIFWIYGVLGWLG